MILIIKNRRKTFKIIKIIKKDFFKKIQKTKEKTAKK